MHVHYSDSEYCSILLFYHIVRHHFSCDIIFFTTVYFQYSPTCHSQPHLANKSHFKDYTYLFDILYAKCDMTCTALFKQ